MISMMTKAKKLLQASISKMPKREQKIRHAINSNQFLGSRQRSFRSRSSERYCLYNCILYLNLLSASTVFLYKKISFLPSIAEMPMLIITSIAYQHADMQAAIVRVHETRKLYTARHDPAKTRKMAIQMLASKFNSVTPLLQ